MPCYVWTDLFGEPRLIGATELAGDIGEFRYAPPFLESKLSSIDPINLPLDRAAFTTRANKGVFGVLADAGPDTWGKRVLASLHPRRMANATGLDILLMTGGHGTGALLFSQSRARAQPRQTGIALADLGAAAEGAQQIEMGEVLREQVKQLLQFGSSLGGVHPKVAVQDETGVQWIAKFRGREDIVDAPRVEWATMTLARECGIDAAGVKLTAVGERAALLVERFDRTANGVLHYASAHALWNKVSASASDALGWASYAGLVALRRKLPGGNVKDDARELFGRLAFNVIIGNTDDHGRNHGFLMDASGAWRLAPAFDVLPTAGGGDVQALGAGPAGQERSLENVIAGAAAFGLNQPTAKEIVESIHAKVKDRLPRLLHQARLPAADRALIAARSL